MTKYNLVILEQAVTEISDSCIYYNSQVGELGNKFEEEVFHLIEIINENPFIFPVKFLNFREAVMARFPFVIIYEVFENQIIVSSIFHTKRNPDKKHKRV